MKLFESPNCSRGKQSFRLSCVCNTVALYRMEEVLQENALLRRRVLQRGEDP